MTPLRQKMTNDMKLRGLSPRTQQSYLEAVTGLAKFFNQSPDRLSKEQVQEYLLYLMEELRVYWTMYRPPLWLFPSSRDVNNPLNISTAQRIYYKAKERARITKGRGIHTLRHCFATHMLEAGHDIRTMLMGHSSIMTTIVYLQVTQKKMEATKSPLDLLELPDGKIVQ